MAEHQATQPVDLGSVEGFLRSKFGDVEEPIERLGHGEWSTAYAFRQAGRDFVVRFGSHRDDFARDLIASRFASNALPVPRITEIGEAFGAFFAISERAFGTYLDDLDEGGMRALLPSLFATLDAMRAVDLSATTGYGGWDDQGNSPFASWRDYLLDAAVDQEAGRVGGWRATMASSPTGSGPFDEAYAHLQTLMPFVPEGRYVIHSDLLNFNVLAADDRIAAVLDWGCGTTGDFLYDLAWFVYWAPVYPAWARIDFAVEALRHYQAIGLQVPHFTERLRCCLVHIGLGDMAYNAFRGRLDRLASGAARTLAIVRSP